MVDQQDNFSEIKSSLSSAKSVFVLIPQNPTLDTTAAALSLYLSLKESGKNVAVNSPSEMRVEQSRLVGIDKVSSKIGNRNLIISFDYREDSIEKVSYNVENQKFNLVIQPRSGFSPLDPESVEFSFEGLDADLIFVLGASKLENLGTLYEKERNAFSKSTLVNLDRNPSNTKFGKINLVDSKSVSISDIVYRLLKKLELPLTADIAGNILKGIEAQTQNLQAPFTGPETFETVAELIRLGAKRSVPSFPPVSPRPWMGSQSRLSPYGNPQSYSPSQPPLSYADSRQQSYPDWQNPASQTAPYYSQPRSNSQSPFPEYPVSPNQQRQSFNVSGSGLSAQNLKSTGQAQPQDIPPITDQLQEDQAPDSPNNDWLKPKDYQGKTKI